MTTNTGQSADAPEGISTPLDTDLYKLTMQCAVLQHFPSVTVSYKLTNRTPDKQLTREAFDWLKDQISKLANLQVSDDELSWLRKTCPYLSSTYLDYLAKFRFKPEEQITISFEPSSSSETETDNANALGALSLTVHGLWVETILYEIPLLALTSEAYFKFVDRDWTHAGQEGKAKRKALKLLRGGCTFSEFGSRRRRDYHTHDLVVRGIVQAVKELDSEASTFSNPRKGTFTGTSNVHLAMKHGTNPIGTIAHEFFMGVAALTDDSAHANERALQYWITTFGRGVLAITLTDTFGTPNFLTAFRKPCPAQEGDEPVAIPNSNTARPLTYADVFVGVRQDSGDPMDYLEVIREFYTSMGLLDPSQNKTKTIVFSDSLNVEKCLRLARATEAVGLVPSFGIGTFFTNDFTRASAAHPIDEDDEKAEKSTPMNIVIKLSEAEGTSAVKLSDDVGKNMGPEDIVRKVKEQVGYADRKWQGGDENKRWG